MLGNGNETDSNNSKQQSVPIATAQPLSEPSPEGSKNNGTQPVPVQQNIDVKSEQPAQVQNQNEKEIKKGEYPTATPVVQAQHVQPIIIEKRAKQQNSCFRTTTRSIKLGLGLLFLFLLGSVFVNVYQALAGDCRDLQSEIDRLEELNNELEETTSDLEEQNARFQAELARYVEQNKELNTTVEVYSSRNVKLAEQIEDLTELSNQLSDVFKFHNQSFAEFKQEVNALLVSLYNSQVETQNSIDDLEETLGNLEDSVASFKAERMEQQQNHINYVNSQNAYFTASRTSLAKQTMGSCERAVDGSSIYSLQEYEMFLERVIDIYFRGSDAVQNNINVESLRQEFPFRDGLTFQSLQEMKIVETLSERSMVISPSLYIQTGL